MHAEINGRPGVIWGNVIVPASGRSKIKIKVIGDLLQTHVHLAFGLEKKEILTSIQDVRSIEIVEGRLWWLLGLGILTLLNLIGIIFIFLFFVLKQRWIVIYTSNVHLILFYKETENVEQFRNTVFSIKRQLMTPAISRTNGTRPSASVNTGSNTQ
jgi:hypothetical protein